MRRSKEIVKFHNIEKSNCDEAALNRKQKTGETAKHGCIVQCTRIYIDTSIENKSATLTGAAADVDAAAAHHAVAATGVGAATSAGAGSAGFSAAAGAASAGAGAAAGGAAGFGGLFTFIGSRSLMASP